MPSREDNPIPALPGGGANGGFPEPPASEPVRVVESAHPVCGGRTRIRLSGYLPSRAVRRVVCERCDVAYACDSVDEVVEEPVAVAEAPVVAEAVAAPPAVPAEPTRRRLRLPSLPSLPSLPPPSSRAWRWAGIPLAAAIVVGVLIAVQGGEDPSPRVVVGPGASGVPESAPAGAQFVSQPGFSLALPPGWERFAPEGGAAFGATLPDGSADATLWIEHAPDLSVGDFERRSLDQLRSLTGSGMVAKRIAAPTEEATIVGLRSDGGKGDATWDVTLRAAGPYRYHLSTVVQPGASTEAVEGAALIHGSFLPDPDGGGEIRTGVVPEAGAEPAPPAEAQAP